MDIVEREREYAGSLNLKQFGWLLAISTVCNIYEPLILLVWIALCALTVVFYLQGRMDRLWYCIAASPGIEVWARMSRAPLVPFEMGKYYLLLAITLIFLHRLQNESEYPAHHIGKTLLFVMVPSLFVSLASFDYESWVFNVLGILQLIIFLIIASGERWDTERFCKTLQYAMIPVIAILVFMTYKSPTYEHRTFGLTANSTGGFGSNQVSTISGVGIVIPVLLIILRRPLIALMPVNYLIIAYSLFKGLITFSRGGMIVAVLAVIVALIPGMLADIRTFFKYLAMFVLFTIMGYGVFMLVNRISGNLLLLRYQGETVGTLDRTREKTLNTITSGRAELIKSDWAIFSDNIFFGIGIGNAKEERVRYGYDPIVAHTEFTRLLSEQGIGGAIVALGLFAFAIYWVMRQRLPVWRGITAALFVLAIFTTFHASMRTNVSVVFYALAAIPVYFYKKQIEE